MREKVGLQRKLRLNERKKQDKRTLEKARWAVLRKAMRA